MTTPAESTGATETWLAQLRAVASVWDLTAEQLDYVHRYRHINEYVYAALAAVTTSNWPRSGRWTCRAEGVAPWARSAVNELLGVVPQLQNSTGSRQRRVEVTRTLFKLYQGLSSLSVTDVPPTMGLFAGLAFLPLVAERSDGFPLWWHAPVRTITAADRLVFSAIDNSLSYEDLPRRFERQMRERGVSSGDPSSVVNGGTIMLVRTIMLHIENGLLNELAFKAFAHVERAMLRYEREQGLGGEPGMLLKVRHLGQVRYRNTLYLYGGNLLERMGDLAGARAWYLRDIDTVELPDTVEHYMTALKTCERLLGAYRTCLPEDRAPLRRLIHEVLCRALVEAGRYAAALNDALANHPDAELGEPKVALGGRRYLVSGEASREPLLIALLYRSTLEGIAYADTSYTFMEAAE